MKREIKFRGKEFETGQWIEGSLTTYPRYYPTITLVENAELIPKKKTCVVLPETVGQFTGLCDKNGKEIYEGDIVKAKEYGIDIPNGVFCSNVAGYDNFSVDYIDGGFRLLNNQRGFLLCKDNHLEVIGNIYDNPELLKENKR